MSKLSLLYDLGVSSFYLNKNEDVINADGENEEGNDLEDDERRRYSGESKNSDRGRHRQQHDHHTTEAQGDFALNLKNKSLSN